MYDTLSDLFKTNSNKDTCMYDTLSNSFKTTTSGVPEYHSNHDGNRARTIQNSENDTSKIFKQYLASSTYHGIIVFHIRYELRQSADCVIHCCIVMFRHLGTISTRLAGWYRYLWSRFVSRSTRYWHCG